MADSVLLSGAAARLVFSIGAANHAVGPFTFACVIKRAAASNWDTIMAADWEGSFLHRLGLSDGNQIFSTVGASDDIGGGNPSNSSTAWQILAVTKATGSVAPRYHSWDGTTWVHDDGSTALANGAAMGTFQIGETGGDTFAGNILIFGIASTVFADGTLEGLGGSHSAWQAAAWSEAVRCDAASGLVSFTAGSMAQTSATGATLDTGDVPSWWDDDLGPGATYEPFLAGHIQGGRW